MNLKPELLSTLQSLGVTDEELVMLQGRMLSTVTGLSASIAALTSQIDVLTAQRTELMQQLTAAQVTVQKLASADPPPEPAPEPAPAPAPEPAAQV